MLMGPLYYAGSIRAKSRACSYYSEDATQNINDILRGVKHILASVLVAAAAASLWVLLITPSLAAQETPLSDEHRERIIATCTTSKASLHRLHRSDASLRVNRGQLYEFISTKLMANFNSRLALGSINGVSLVSLAADYNQSLGQFRESYQRYEVQLSAVLRIDCTRDPEAFYYAIADAREKRREVNAETIKINQLIRQYYTAFTELKLEFETAANGVEASRG